MRIEPQSRTETLKQMQSINWRLLLFCMWFVGFALYALIIVLFPSLPRPWAIISAGLVSVSTVYLVWQHSKSLPEQHGSHYISTENGYLQIKGLSNNDVIEARFRISELKNITLGRRRLIALANPTVRSLDESALIVEEVSGSSVAFEGVGWIYRKAELTELILSVSREIARTNPT